MPIQPPRELAPASHGWLMPRLDATDVCNGPKRTLAFVQDPVMNAPRPPTNGATIGYALPVANTRASAISLVMPE